MNASIKSIVTAAVLAVAGLAAVGTASAREYAPVQNWQAPPRYAYDGGRYDRDRDDWRDACRAPRLGPEPTLHAG